MSTNSLRRMLKSLAFSSIIVCACAAAAAAQTPTATPVPSTPAQQDATRPPGTERNQPVPPEVRPNPNPAAPPGAIRTNPQSPPGVNVPPATTPPSRTTDMLPPSTTTVPLTQPGDTTITAPAPGQPLSEPTFPVQEARPVPPLPDLTRLGVTSDNIMTLTLNEAIRLALENNNDIEVSRNDVKINETTLTALEGVFDPIFTLNPQITRLAQSRQNIFSTSADQSGTITQTDILMNSNINKQFGRGGGNYEFFFNNNQGTTNNTSDTLNPSYSSSLGVTFTQPLLRNRATDRNRRDIRIQRKRLEQSDADFRRKTIDIISQVQRAYWDLVFALRDQQNRISNLNLTRENLRRVEAQISAGASAPLERAEVQTELANRESDLLLVTQNVSIAENNLKQLLLRDPLAPQWSAQLTPTDEPTFDSTPVNLNAALEEAQENRPELRRLRLQREISDIDIKFFKNQTMARIDLQATVATTGLAGSPVTIANNNTNSLLISGNPSFNADAFLLNLINSTRVAVGLPLVGSPSVPGGQNTSTTSPNLIGGYGRALRNLFGLDTHNIVVGVTFEMPFRNRTAEANLAGARIQATQLEATTRLQEQIVVVEVRNAAQAVETARRRVLTARSARENAEQQLAGEQRLYQVGRSTTFILFQRENTLVNARNAEIRAETDYNKALADLQRATSTTLRANNVIVE